MDDPVQQFQCLTVKSLFRMTGTPFFSYPPISTNEHSLISLSALVGQHIQKLLVDVH